MLLLLSTALAITNGEPTTGFPAVVAVQAWDPSSGAVYTVCGGSLVAPDTVLTAGHCLADVAAVYPGGAVQVAVGYDTASATGIQEIIPVVTGVAHPAFDEAALTDDVALLTLARPVDDVAPLALNADPLRDADVGRLYRVVGWGVTDAGLVDTTQKRTADIPLSGFDDLVQYGRDDTHGRNACDGDSGGAVLRILRDGYALAGVISFVQDVDGDGDPCVGGTLGATRADAVLDWVSGEADVATYADGDQEVPGTRDTGEGSGDGSVDGSGDGSGGGCSTAPGWTPPAGPLAGPLTGLSALLLLTRRRR